MWTKIINYNSLSGVGAHLGAKVRDSDGHGLNFFLLGQRDGRFIFRLDRVLFSNYFLNKVLINKIAVNRGNFLFITSRKEYYNAVRRSADACSQMALLWRASALGNLNIRSEVLEELYDPDRRAFSETAFNNCLKPNVFVLFDNEKFRSKKLISEAERFKGVPLFSVIDTDSIFKNTMFPILGNDDSVLSVYFYSAFVSYCIVSGRSLNKLTDYERKTIG